MQFVGIYVVIIFYFSSSSLFTVSSPNPAFVYVQPSYVLLTNPVKWCLDRLIKHSVNLEGGTYQAMSFFNIL